MLSWDDRARRPLDVVVSSQFLSISCPPAQSMRTLSLVDSIVSSLRGNDVVLLQRHLANVEKSASERQMPSRDDGAAQAASSATTIPAAGQSLLHSIADIDEVEIMDDLLQDGIAGFDEGGLFACPEAIDEDGEAQAVIESSGLS